MKTVQLLSLFVICFIQSIINLPQRSIPEGSIIVAQDGSGDFEKIQDAIDSLDTTSTNERVIYIKKGTYYEQILNQKNHVTFVGEDRDSTIITYDLNNNKTGSSSKCATYLAYGNDLKGFDLTFENTAPFPGSNAQAPAINCNGKRHYFENCRFLSFQDTLLSNKGHHYFKDCYIRGFTDFIWGSGRAVFDNCTLYVDSNNRLGRAYAYLTANGNKDGNYTEGGFLLTKNKVLTDGSAFYLGRAWKQYCYVIFHKTEFPGDKLMSDGWLTFSKTPEYNETSKVGEFECYGNDYSPEGRVEWATEFTSAPTPEEFLVGDMEFTTNSFYQQLSEEDKQPEVIPDQELEQEKEQESATTATTTVGSSSTIGAQNDESSDAGFLFKVNLFTVFVLSYIVLNLIL